MRTYRTEEYKKNLEGNIFRDSTSNDYKDCDGLKVKRVIRELTDKDYDRELIDDSDKNTDGKSRYEINCMYEVEIENGRIIQVFEDEINPDYRGDFEE